MLTSSRSVEHCHPGVGQGWSCESRRFQCRKTQQRNTAAAATEQRHDDLLIGQIFSAANFVQQTTGLALADMQPLRSAIVSAVRDLYNGEQKIGPNAAAFSLLAPFRSFKAG